MSSPLGLIVETTLNSTKIGTYKVVNSKAVQSLFVGGGQFSPYPSEVNAETGSVAGIRTANDVHKDEIYDTSITSLIEYTNEKGRESMRLTAADFAYLKNLGVYPNNRLIIARRFPAGVPNDLTSIKTPPMSTLISWVKDGDDFISVSYNEVWEPASVSFEEVLNDIGKDVQASKDQGGNKIGSLVAGGLSSLPFPGFMEGIQYEVMKNMGLTDAGIGNSPLGNPNLIREAKMRSTLGKGDSGSGLKASFSIKMVVEYEQKFINGVDPTLVYMDIIQNALTFGTSESAFQFSSAFGTGTSGVIKDLISGDVASIARAIQKFVTSLLDAISKVGKDIISALSDVITTEENDVKIDVLSVIKKAFAATIGHVISKYKIKLIGISNALTGSSSAPWHVTIGNPKKPTFSSGDMLCSDVNLTVGKNLSFNDLPSYIKIEFTLTNARNLGAQEIFNRFNTGKGRSYTRLGKSFVESPDITFGTASEATTVVDGKSVTKNQVTPIARPQKVDDYLVTGNDGPDYISYGAPISGNPPTTGDSTTAQLTNNTSNKSSNQSQSTQSGSVASVPPASTFPTPEPGSVPLTSSQIRNASDSDLSARSATIDEELKNTPAMEGNYINPKYSQLQQEKRNITSAQKDRVEDAALGITSNVQPPPNSFFQEPDPLA